ncbi:MAG: formate dehydrogenase accessory sulfurtransferase FdhD [Desulfovibrionaceae bacterium]|nr:formate dehydrogenase accessory sulfurtransferase FdhD [Desulfovibrionaceae bacterium]
MQGNNAPDRREQVELKVPQFRVGGWKSILDTVTQEVALTVSWSDPASGGKGRKELWAWPVELDLLALGHVLLDVLPPAEAMQRTAEVTVTGEHSCAVMLKDSAGSAPPPPVSWDEKALLRAMRDFISAAGLWDVTGCFHRAGVFDPASGLLLTRAEDIGRHNCLDRLAGWSATGGQPLSDKVLLTSARITASYCAKALRAGFRILVSQGAVTTASIAMAREAEATLIGFARPGEERFTVFSDDARRMGYPGKDD